VTAPERPPCPSCGGELRFSHREYAGGGRSTAVLRCRSCGGAVRGRTADDRERPRSGSGRKRPLPEGGQPDNYVLDAETAERLRRSLAGEGGEPAE
jgi:hypothetical protein